MEEFLRSRSIVTAHDAFSIGFNKPEVVERFDRFRSAPGDAALLHREFGVARKNGWSIMKGWETLQKSSISTLAYLRPIEYAPFDTRAIFYQEDIVWRPVRAIMGGAEKNLIILCSRVTKDALSAFVVSSPFRHKAAVRYDITYGFPLYNRNNEINFSDTFGRWIETTYPIHLDGREIFGFVYSVLNAPAYKAKFSDLLGRNFPRIPFPRGVEQLAKLSSLGWALIQAHLLREVPRRGLGGYHGVGDHRVEAVRYSPVEKAIWINKTQSFAPVPPEVWDFRIGGYQVLDKYLKSRKGRVLSLDEINHLAAVADVLAFTIEQMARIDEAYLAAFPEHAGGAA